MRAEELIFVSLTQEMVLSFAPPSVQPLAAEGRTVK